MQLFSLDKYDEYSDHKYEVKEVLNNWNKLMPEIIGTMCGDLSSFPPKMLS